jgi:hypothetical protein
LAGGPALSHVHGIGLEHWHAIDLNKEEEFPVKSRPRAENVTALLELPGMVVCEQTMTHVVLNWTSANFGAGPSSTTNSPSTTRAIHELQGRHHARLSGVFSLPASAS